MFHVQSKKIIRVLIDIEKIFFSDDVFIFKFVMRIVIH